jgi:hypothetical protein
MAKIQNYEPVFDLEESTLGFAKQADALKKKFSLIIGIFW